MFNPENPEHLKRLFFTSLLLSALLGAGLWAGLQFGVGLILKWSLLAGVDLFLTMVAVFWMIIIFLSTHGANDKKDQCIASLVAFFIPGAIVGTTLALLHFHWIAILLWTALASMLGVEGVNTYLIFNTARSKSE